MTSRSTAACAALALVGWGCSDVDEHPWLNSAYAEISLHEGASLCRGDVELDVDDHVEQTAALLGVVAQTFTLVAYETAPVEDCATDYAGGCFVPPDLVRTTRASLRHEVVHVVSYPLGRSTAFLDEGVAEALSGTRTEVKGGPDIFEHADSPRSDISYSLAAHFVRWMLDSYGVETVVDLLGGAAYQDAVGIDRDAVFESFEATAPWSYPGLNSCKGPDLALPELDETLTVELDGRCGAPGVQRTSLVTYRKFRLEVPEAIELAVALPPTVGLRITACQLEPLAEEPATDMQGDIRMEWRWGLRNGTLFSAERDAPAAFPAGVYEVLVEFGVEDIERFTLTRSK